MNVGGLVKGGVLQRRKRSETALLSSGRHQNEMREFNTLLPIAASSWNLLLSTKSSAIEIVIRKEL